LSLPADSFLSVLKLSRIDQPEAEHELVIGPDREDLSFGVIHLAARLKIAWFRIDDGHDSATWDVVPNRPHLWEGLYSLYIALEQIGDCHGCRAECRLCHLH